MFLSMGGHGPFRGLDAPLALLFLYHNRAWISNRPRSKPPHPARKKRCGAALQRGHPARSVRGIAARKAPRMPALQGILRAVARIQLRASRIWEMRLIIRARETTGERHTIEIPHTASTMGTQGTGEAGTQGGAARLKSLGETNKGCARCWQKTRTL